MNLVSWTLKIYQHFTTNIKLWHLSCLLQRQSARHLLTYVITYVITKSISKDVNRRGETSADIKIKMGKKREANKSGSYCKMESDGATMSHF